MISKKYYDGIQIHDVLNECIDDPKLILKIPERFAKLKTADVVEVVRCKNCKFNPNTEWVGCPMAGIEKRTDDSFCSFGERREDEEEDDALEDEYSEICYECQGYGDDYYEDEAGNFICNCDDCIYMEVEHEFH